MSILHSKRVSASSRGRAIIIAAALLSSACSTVRSPTDTINPAFSPTPVPPTAGYVSWRLPKTVIDATVTFKYRDCKALPNQLPVIELERTVALATRAVPDDLIFGEAKPFDPMVRVPISALTSFFDDRSLTVGHSASGILTQLGAVAEDQTAAIAGNVLTSAVKIGSIAFGVAPGGPAAVGDPEAQCSPVPGAIKAEIDRLKALLRNPATTDDQAVAYSRQLADQQKKLDKLTIVVTRTIDPGVTPVVPGGTAALVGRSGLIATILPSLKQLKEASWLEGSDAVQLNAINDAAVSIFLDFSRATPPIVAGGCPPAPAACRRNATVIDRKTQFREPAYIPLIVVSGRDPANKKNEFELTMNGGRSGGPIPFAQYGIPRALPIKAGFGEKLAWSYSFNEFGEQSTVSFGSSARGAKATSLMASAAGAAASVAAQERTDDAKADPETARLQSEAAKLKAMLDILNHQKALEDHAKDGRVPD